LHERVKLSISVERIKGFKGLGAAGNKQKALRNYDQEVKEKVGRPAARERKRGGIGPGSR